MAGGNNININLTGGNIFLGSINQLENSSEKHQQLKKISPSIFISYRRADDNGLIGRIYDRLVHEFGKDNIFKDIYSIDIGENFKKTIENKIIMSNFLLAIIGENWLDTSYSNKRTEDFVRLEILLAKENNIPILPITLSKVVMPSKKELPSELHFLNEKNSITIRPNLDFESDIKKLTKKLINA